MKKIFLAIVLSISLFKASADEGMWLPMLLGEQVYADMVKKGVETYQRAIVFHQQVVS